MNLKSLQNCLKTWVLNKFEKVCQRQVKIMKSEGKPFQICLKNMFSNNFIKLLFKIHNLSLS